jgi:hypothetical protein
MRQAANKNRLLTRAALFEGAHSTKIVAGGEEIKML